MYPALTNDSAEVDAAFLQSRNQGEELLRHFGFREAPFGVTPNPEFLFFSASHRDALQGMIHSIESNLGFTVLLGEPGTGKTSLLFQLLKQYQECARTAFIFQTQCRRNDLLRLIASELELPWEKRDEVSLHQRLNEILVEEARAGRRVLIIVDEAQNLQTSSLEAIRLLSDFETPVAKLLHVVLAGSGRLGETLRSPELSQLAQRIFTLCRLGPLTAKEVSEYVSYRLSVAGSKATEEIFPPESLAAIAEKSGGIPRLINSICFRSLSLAYAMGDRRVSSAIVHHAAQDLDLAKSRGMNFPFARLAPREEPDLRDRLAEAISAADQDRPAVCEAELRAQEQRPTGQEQVAHGPHVSTENNQHLSSPSLVEADSVPPRESGLLADSKSPSDQDVKPLSIAETAAPKLVRANNRRSLAAMAAVVMLLAFGLPVGWRALNGRIRASEQRSEATKSGVFSAEQQDPKPASISSSQPNISTVNTAAANLRPEDHIAPVQPRTHPVTPAVETLPYTPVPSKIARQSSSGERLNGESGRSDLFDPGPRGNSDSGKGDTSATTNLAGLYKNSGQMKLPLASLPAPPPRLDKPVEPAKHAPTMPVTAHLKPAHVVQPEYPKMAQRSRIEGEVLVELEVDSNGHVQRVRALSGDPMLKEAAEEAARKWRFEPSAEGQTTEPVVTQVRFKFRLNSESGR